MRCALPRAGQLVAIVLSKQIVRAYQGRVFADHEAPSKSAAPYSKIAGRMSGWTALIATIERPRNSFRAAFGASSYRRSPGKALL
jgi:hypothetical protein